MTWLPRLFLAIGLGLLVLSAFGLWNRLDRVGPVQTTGTVIRLESETINRFSPPTERPMTSFDETSVYCPIVAFDTLDGRTVEVRVGTCASPPAYVVGEAVTVDYDPAQPETAAVGGFFARYGIVLAGAVVGLAATGVGLAIRRSLLTDPSALPPQP